MRIAQDAGSGTLGLPLGLSPVGTVETAIPNGRTSTVCLSHAYVVTRPYGTDRVRGRVFPRTGVLGYSRDVPSGLRATDSRNGVEETKRTCTIATACIQRSGFTLIEVLVSIVIFVLIAAAVYASFSSVTVATDDARIGAEEMRLRQFLSRNLLNNLATVVDAYIAGPPNAQDMTQNMQSSVNPELAFVGVSEKGSDGARDTLEFASSSPMLGGISPPGSLKRVRYEVTEDSESNLLTAEEARRAEEAGTQLRLTVRETRLQGGAWQGGADLRSRASDLFQTDSPSWSVPVSSFDVAFFDGKDWVEEWDSAATLMMPWCLRIRINYARTEDEKRADSQAGLDAAKDPDYEVIVPLPVGAGTVIPTAEWMVTVFPEVVPGEGGGGGTNKDQNGKSTGKSTS